MTKERTTYMVKNTETGKERYVTGTVETTGFGATRVWFDNPVVCGPYDVVTPVGEESHKT